MQERLENNQWTSRVQYGTVVVVSTEIFFTDEKVVIAVKFPELAVDDVEVLIREEVHYLVDVFFDIQPADCLTTTSSSSPSSLLDLETPSSYNELSLS